ncbi:polyketide synthase [Stemphylium lycopersici]|nr:polyketide synthase [Stemphylium lycopersici]
MSSLVNYEPLVRSTLTYWLDRTEAIFENTGNSCDFNQWLKFFAFDVIGELTWSKRLGFVDENKDVDNITMFLARFFNYIAPISQMPILDRFLWRNPISLFAQRIGLDKRIHPVTLFALNRSYDRASQVEKVRRFGLSNEEKANPQGIDFLSKLAQASHDYPFMDDKRILSTCTSIIFAGAETTSISLSAIFYFLVRHPHVYARLMAEIDEAVANGTIEARPNRIVSWLEARKLPYLDAVVHESFRMHPPPGLILERVVPSQGMHILGSFIPGRTIVGCNAWVVHRRPEVFGLDVDVFRPERWIDASPEKLKVMKSSMLQFGSGARTCLVCDEPTAEAGLLYVVPLLSIRRTLDQPVQPATLAIPNKTSIWPTRKKSDFHILPHHDLETIQQKPISNMGCDTTTELAGSRLLLFGPQKPGLVLHLLSELRNTIISNPKLDFLIKTVKTLPSLWEDVVLPCCPELQRLTSANDHLQQLAQFFKTGSTDGLPSKLQYEFLLVPLTVISQIVEYMSLDQEGDVQGFCVGFLAAAAVTSSHSAFELERWTATAIRLALCIGAIVEIDEREGERSSDRSSTWSVRWRSDAEEDHLRRTLESFPTAYISCTTDVDRVTLTISGNDSTDFWHETVQSAVQRYGGREVSVLSIGHSSGVIPRSYKLAAAAHKSLTVNSAPFAIKGAANSSMHPELNGTTTSMFLPFQPTSEKPINPRTSASSMPIAVIGMACRFPQADSLEQFWSLINSDTNACTPVPETRFKTKDLWREPKGPFFGNFVEDADAFDHRFFNLSAREAASMDPQQRLILQVSYEAMESAGYPTGSESPRRPVGCYIGASYVEYEDNVSSEHATAFSGTGTMRAFISGKALQSTDCSVAIAGGVNIITSPTLYQNLAAASFLSPTGASKAFDADANGYCRGEGAGMLVLKPLDRAIADRDRIIGTIIGSAVNQNSSCTPITVPHSNSQTNLYLQALASSGILPSDVTYVEAHGTGTPVGDPIECASIRAAFGDANRTQEVVIGSVKDVIGHTEAASGVAGIIKTLLMMHHGSIPKQPNFNRLSPKIPGLEPDKIAIANRTRLWNVVGRRSALVNNYGASGSNAAIVLQEYTIPVHPANLPGVSFEKTREYPIFLSAKTQESLQAYAVALKSFIDRQVSVTLADIAYNLARKQNRALMYNSSWTTASLDSLREDLDRIAVGGGKKAQLIGDKKAVVDPPVVLCFGGQTGRSIFLSRAVYEDFALLRVNLQHCEDACNILELPSLFPQIFDPTPVDDLVSLHALLFSVQYASAKAWIQSGVRVAVVVGHSFGQLTALCVAGNMSLLDGLRLVTGRARLIQKLWSADPGVMLSVKGNEDALSRLTTHAIKSRSVEVDVACHNGPRNIVFAGDAIAIDNLEEYCQNFQGLKTTKLANSHAYHSRLADPILKPYRAIAESIEYQAPWTHVETCSPTESWSKVDATKIVQHTREAVHFSEAVQRIASKYPSCVWLEAGSASPIIPMVRRALDPARGSSDLFVPTDLGKGNPWTSLSKASCGLWSAGLSANFWAFHGDQADQYRLLNLPPYQFTKNRHWMQFRPYRLQQETVLKSPQVAYSSPELLQRVRYGAKESIFAINTSHEVFELSVRGHAVVGQSLCPAALYFELAIRAVKLLHDSELGLSSRVPHIEDLLIVSPLTLKLGNTVFVALTQSPSQSERTKWNFTFFTGSDAAASIAKSTIHASGSICLLESQALSYRFRSLSRLIGTKRHNQIASHPDAERLSGNIIYKVFGRVVNYASYYKGVKSVMPESGDDDVLICSAIGEVLWSESFFSSRDTRTWKVYSNMEFEDKSTATNDIFILDAENGTVVLAFLNAKFHRVSLTSLRRVLSKLNKDQMTFAPSKAFDVTYTDTSFPNRVNNEISQEKSTNIAPHGGPALPLSTQSSSYNTDSAASDIALEHRKMLSDIFGIPTEDVKLDSDLADLGVDSLMITEISAEVQKRFGAIISVEDLQDMTDVQSLVRKIGAPSSTAEVPAPASQQTIAAAQQGAQSQRNGVASTNVLTNRHVERQEDDRGVASIGSDWYGNNGYTFDAVVQESGFGGFCSHVYPLQANLVVAYAVEALAGLGCDLGQLHTGQPLPKSAILPKHKKLLHQMYRIVEDAGLVANVSAGPNAIRTSTPVSHLSSQELHDAIIEKFPQHAAEHQLLHTMGARLADCLTGRIEPLSLMFGSVESRRLMGEVYTDAPMFRAATIFLSNFLMDVCGRFQGKREIRILELGAGTGGTTNFLVQQLQKSGLGHKVRYTFSDISGSFVAAARKRFGGLSFVDYAVINVEKDPATQYQGMYDIIISTNCIHATSSLVRSCKNIEYMLRPDGMLCLVELTQNLYWFDLVFGLVEGWWLFEDGRNHALASVARWKEDLYTSGFSWVNWSSGNSEESKILRVIVASPSPYSSRHPTTALELNGKSAVIDTQETVTFKHAGSLPLNADIYYPSKDMTVSKPRPVALMIHGGGHVMLSRKDVRPKQTQLLLDAGFIPVSIDYRLCPETTLLEGPMTDVRDALSWARKTLPHLSRKRSDIPITGDRVVVVGWSTGGTLAMSLGWTAPSAGLPPPDAILAFYCPTDYEDECWNRETKPFGDASIDSRAYDLYEGVGDAPIVAYNPPASARAAGGWMTRNDPRSRILLHMNWYGQTLPVLIHGLKHKNSVREDPTRLPKPSSAQIKAISPLAQIQKGIYRTPTFMIHPKNDDLIPWEQSQRTANELRRQGVESEVRIVSDAIHLFDMYSNYESSKEAVRAVAEGLAHALATPASYPIRAQPRLTPIQLLAYGSSSSVGGA